MSRTDEPLVRPFGEVAAEIGHELNNQLGIVSGRAELARMYLQRGRMEDVLAGVEVILRQMERMRLLSERLRGMRQEPQPLHPVNVREAICNALRADPWPHLETNPESLPEVPPAWAHIESLNEMFAALGRHLRENASVADQPGAAAAPRTQVTLSHTEASRGVVLEIKIQGLPLEAARRLLAETTRLLAPSGLGLRADFPEGATHILVEFPLVPHS